MFERYQRSQMFPSPPNHRSTSIGASRPTPQFITMRRGTEADLEDRVSRRIGRMVREHLENHRNQINSEAGNPELLRQIERMLAESQNRGNEVQENTHLNAV